MFWRRSKLTEGIAVGAVLLLYWWMATSTLPRLGLTFDEAGHIVSGYAAWQRHDYRVNAEDGILATRVAALPLLDLGLKFPADDTGDWVAANSHGLGYDFLFGLGNPFDSIVGRARAITAIFGVGLLWLIFGWTRRLFGRTAAWLALVVAAFSPTLLAQGGLATSDMVVSCCLLAAVSAWWALLHRLTWLRLLVTALISGLTLLAKMSGALLGPMVLLLLLVRIAGARPWRMALFPRHGWIRQRRAMALAAVPTTAVVLGLGLVVVWSGYGFRFAAAMTDGRFELPWSEVLGETRHVPNSWDGQASRLAAEDSAAPGPTMIDGAVAWARSHRVLPEAYLWGFAYTSRSVRQRPAFFLGEYLETGTRWFFPIVFLLKSTPTELLLLALGLTACAGHYIWKSPGGIKRQSPRHGWYRATPVLVLVLVYGAVAFASRLNIGQRHLLPAYAAVFIFGGAAVLWSFRLPRVFVGGLLVCLAGWQIIECARARPFYLSYFTPAVGGADRGWRYLTDSSLDWGQGLPDLKTWMTTKEQRGDRAPVFLSYFGWDSPQFRGIDATRFGDAQFDSGARNFPAPVTGGWFAISATHFQRIYLHLGGPWTEAREKLYRAIWQSLPRSAAVVQAMSATERARFTIDASDLETMQLGRLCCFLQGREPEKIVGASILLFKLSDEEVRFALSAPLAEWNARLAPRRAETLR